MEIEQATNGPCRHGHGVGREELIGSFIFLQEDEVIHCCASISENHSTIAPELDEEKMMYVRAAAADIACSLVTADTILEARFVMEVHSSCCRAYKMRYKLFRR